MHSNKPLKVLMIAPTSFFGDYGCHVRILEETQSLQALGHQVVITTYYKGRDLPGITIRRTPPTPWHPTYEVGSSRHKYAFDVLLFATTLATAIRWRPNVLHAHLHEGALIGAVISRMLGIPLVLDFQGSLTAEMVDHHFLNANGRSYPWWRRLERALDHAPQAILTSTLHASRLLREQFGVPAGRITPLPDCVNAEFFRPPPSVEQAASLRSELGIPAGRNVIAYLGLLAEYQGTGLLLDVLAHLLARGQDVHLLLMGYPNVEEYRGKAAERGLSDRITFTGRVPYEQAPRFLSLGDIAVAPKLSLSEGNGKLLNYMAMALPVVAFDTPVNREYLGEQGLFAPPRDVHAFASRLVECLDNPARRRAIGAQLRRRAIERYSWRAAAERMVEVYQELIAVRQSPIAEPLASGERR